MNPIEFGANLFTKAKEMQNKTVRACDVIGKIDEELSTMPEPFKMDFMCLVTKAVDKCESTKEIRHFEPKQTDVPDTNVGDIYECSCGYGWDKSKVVRHHFCPNCGKAVDLSYNSIKTELKPCEDCISRQAVLNLAKFDGRDGLGSIIHAFDVEQLPPVTPQPNKWIPVSERLPDIHNYCMKYLVTDCHKHIHTSLFTESGGKSWWSYEDVIAWMPLPKPYVPDTNIGKMSEIPTGGEVEE